MRKPEPGRRCHGDRGAAGRSPGARPRDGSGSRRQRRFGQRLRPGPGGGGALSAGRVRSTGPLGLQGQLNPGPAGVPQGGHLGVVAEGQRGDLLGVAEPVLLGARVQVLHHHQAATRVGEEACGTDRARQVSTAWRASPRAQLQRLTHPCPPPHGEGLGTGGPEAQQDRPPAAPGPWPHRCPASRRGWRARSRYSPRRPSGAAARCQQGAGRGPAGKQPGRGCPPQTLPSGQAWMEPASVAPVGGSRGHERGREGRPGRASWGWPGGQGGT